MKLDYRCRGTGCATAYHCRRFLPGDAAKTSTLPFAAFDMRDTVECDGHLPRIMAPVRAESEGAGVINDKVSGGR